MLGQVKHLLGHTGLLSGWRQALNALSTVHPAPRGYCDKKCRSSLGALAIPLGRCGKDDLGSIESTVVALYFFGQRRAQPNCNGLEQVP